ncbi:unnamed protein product, partial [Brenthis ino]
MSFKRALVTIVVVVQVSRVRVISVRDAKSSHFSDPSVYSVIASMFGNHCHSAAPPAARDLLRTLPLCQNALLA